MSLVYSFPPIADAAAERLILGSMPGAASLAAGRYYAHPHNAFWPILAELVGFAPDADYETRVSALRAAHIALWDVLQSCSREGSLDARIARTSEVPNDFASFFARHPKICHVYFNGSKAEAAFRQRVLPQLDASRLHFIRLPSTSPAHAAQSRAEKLAAWRAILAEPSSADTRRDTPR